MDKRLIFVSLALLVLQTCAFAVVETADCNEYYNFDGLKFVRFDTEKEAYDQGDIIRVNYEIRNDFGSPLVEGGIKVLALYKGPEDVSLPQDGDIIDDFFIKRDISLRAGDSYSSWFEWKVPEVAKPGVYVFNVYFTVDERFNVAGLSFMSSVPAKKTVFEVAGVNQEPFMLDKGRTKFNGKTYEFRSLIPEVESGRNAVVSTYLNNPEGRNVEVTLELFKWDDMGYAMDPYTRREYFADSRALQYDMGALPEGSYVARVVASSGDWKSIIKTRFFVRGKNARFIWVGLDSFPLFPGSESTIAFCMSNGASEPGDILTSFPVTGTVTILNPEGETILEESYDIDSLDSAVIGRKITFTPDRRYTRLMVKADIYGADGKRMDYVELVYDYSKFMNIEKELRIASVSAVEDTIKYEIEYTDEYDDPVDGAVVVYVTDAGGGVMAMSENKISGTIQGEFRVTYLQDGQYTIKAIETYDRLSDQKVFNVKRSGDAGVKSTSSTLSGVSTTMPVLETGSSNDLTIMLLAIVVLLLIFIVVKSMSRPKSSGEGIDGAKEVMQNTARGKKRKKK